MLEPSNLPISTQTAQSIYKTLVANKLLTNSEHNARFWQEQLCDPFTELRLHPTQSLKLYYANRRFYVESEHPENDGADIQKVNKALFVIYRDHLRQNDYL